MTLPNYMVIGAARSGTTALTEYLGQHPDVFMSDPKEPHFMAFANQRVDFKGPGDEIMMNDRAITDEGAYRRLFEGVHEARVGEGSVSYLYYPRALENIQLLCPDALLICMLREPKARAFSAYGFMRARLFEPLPFAEALYAEAARIEEGWHHIWHYTSMSRYAEQLRRVYAHFPREQVKVIVYEDFRSDPDAVLHECWQFLGVDVTFRGRGRPRPVVSGEPRNPLLHRLLTDAWLMKDFLKPFAPRSLRRNLYRRLTAANLRKSVISPEAIGILEASLKSEVTLLEDLLSRKVAAWR